VETHIHTQNISYKYYNIIRRTHAHKVQTRHYTHVYVHIVCRGTYLPTYLRGIPCVLLSLEYYIIYVRCFSIHLLTISSKDPPSHCTHNIFYYYIYCGPSVHIIYRGMMILYTLARWLMAAVWMDIEMRENSRSPRDYNTHLYCIILYVHNNNIQRIREVCDSHNGMRACVYILYIYIIYILYRYGCAETTCQKKMNRERACSVCMHAYIMSQKARCCDATNVFFSRFYVSIRGIPPGPAEIYE